MVFDVLHILVAIEIHHQCAHHCVVVQMHPSSHRIEVGHHPIAQTVIPHDALIGRMPLGSDVPHLAQGPLTMRSVDADETAKLVPSRLQFPPFLQVIILLMRLVVNLLCPHIAVLHTETALIHSPEGKT